MTNFAKSLLLAARPKTLTASLVPIVVGGALAHGVFRQHHWWISVVAFLSAICIQVATNLFNDAIDFKTGADSAARIGPTRVTQAGMLRESTVWHLAFTFAGAALLLGIPLVVVGGWPIVAIGLASLALAYGYTGGPYPLAYNGLGDLFVVLFFGVIAVSGMVLLHVGTIPVEALVAGLQVGLLCTVMIAINNVRDMAQDVVVGKRTLAVLLGERAAKLEVAGLLIVPVALLSFWGLKGHAGAALCPLLTAPLMVKLWKKIQSTPPSPAYNSYLAQAALIHLTFGLLLALGLGM